MSILSILIDGIDSTVYGFKYLRKEMSLPTAVVYGQEWLKNGYKPLLGKSKYRYTLLVCYFRYTGTQNDYETMKSVFLQKIKECTLKFSDIDYYYDVIYDSEAKIDKVNPTNVDLGIKFNIYSKYKPEVAEIANRVASKTINVSGNLDTPAIVEITPSINLIDIVITGLGESFTIKNLTAGQKVIISGEDGTVFQGGVNKFTDWDGWEFPKLSPGSNTITFSRSNCDITIKYNPRYI